MLSGVWATSATTHSHKCQKMHQFIIQIDVILHGWMKTDVSVPCTYPKIPIRTRIRTRMPRRQGRTRSGRSHWDHVCVPIILIGTEYKKHWSTRLSKDIRDKIPWDSVFVKSLMPRIRRGGSGGGDVSDNGEYALVHWNLLRNTDAVSMDVRNTQETKRPMEIPVQQVSVSRNTLDPAKVS